MDFTSTVLTSVGGSGALSLMLIFVTKTWWSERIQQGIRAEYATELESHKAKLAAENSKQLEQFKAQLQVASSERSIRLTHVFEKTVETISETYKRLLALHDAVADYTSPVELQSTPPKSERRKVVGQSFEELRKYYRPRRPFLPKETAAIIDDFMNKHHKVAFKFMVDIEEGREEKRWQRAVATGQEAKGDTWLEADEFVKNEAADMLARLDDDLRTILGLLEGSPSPHA